MSIDQQFEGAAREHTAPPPGPTAEEAPPSVRLQILSTEHWSLLATRSLTWNESFARTQMFLSVLSADVVALALVAQATRFDTGFKVFALITLPVVLFLGVAGFIRLVAANGDENRWVLGMNRIRAKYLELAPDLEPVFVTDHHDDFKGMVATAGWGTFPTFFGLVTTPAVVGVVDAAIGGVIAYLIADLATAVVPASVGIGCAVFAVGVLAVVRYMAVQQRATTGRMTAMNPTPEEAH